MNKKKKNSLKINEYILFFFTWLININNIKKSKKGIMMNTNLERILINLNDPNNIRESNDVQPQSTRASARRIDCIAKVPSGRHVTANGKNYPIYIGFTNIVNFYDPVRNDPELVRHASDVLVVFAYTDPEYMNLTAQIYPESMQGFEALFDIKQLQQLHQPLASRGKIASITLFVEAQQRRSVGAYNFFNRTKMKVTSPPSPFYFNSLPPNVQTAFKIEEQATRGLCMELLYIGACLLFEKNTIPAFISSCTEPFYQYYTAINVEKPLLVYADSHSAQKLLQFVDRESVINEVRREFVGFNRSPNIDAYSQKITAFFQQHGINEAAVAQRLDEGWKYLYLHYARTDADATNNDLLDRTYQLIETKIIADYFARFGFTIYNQEDNAAVRYVDFKRLFLVYYNNISRTF